MSSPAFGTFVNSSLVSMAIPVTFNVSTSKQEASFEQTLIGLYCHHLIASMESPKTVEYLKAWDDVTESVKEVNAPLVVLNDVIKRQIDESGANFLRHLIAELPHQLQPSKQETTPVKPDELVDEVGPVKPDEQVDEVEPVTPSPQPEKLEEELEEELSNGGLAPAAAAAPPRAPTDPKREAKEAATKQTEKLVQAYFQDPNGPEAKIFADKLVKIGRCQNGYEWGFDQKTQEFVCQNGTGGHRAAKDKIVEDLMASS